MATYTIRFSKIHIESIEPPESGRNEYRDETQRNLYLRVTHQNIKTFSVIGRVAHGKLKRITIGKFPAVSLEQARRRAKNIVSLLADGIDPNEEKNKQLMAGLTLSDLLEDFFSHRTLADSTRWTYEKDLNCYLSDWMSSSIRSISRKDITTRYKEICNRTVSKANATMRILRSLYNFAIAHYRDDDDNSIFQDNPVSALSDQKLWIPNRRRKNMVKPRELPILWEAIEQLCRHETDASPKWLTGKYIQVLTCTGLRGSEASLLAVSLSAFNILLEMEVSPAPRGYWNQIEKTIDLLDTKNGDPRMVPVAQEVSDWVDEIVERHNHHWLFPATNPLTPMNEASFRYWIKTLRDNTGLEFTRHDLRRTFTTTVNSLQLPDLTLKQLLGHRFDRETDDVTGGYIVYMDDSLRNAAQQVVDKIIQYADP